MKLTAKQEKFCQGIASGMNQSDAYRAAYNCGKMTKKTVWEKASALAANDKVTARIAELKDSLSAKQLWTREQSVKALSEIAVDDDTRPSDKISAIKELNSMHGFNAPQKVDHSSSDGSMSPAEPRVDPSKLDLETLLKLRDAVTDPTGA